MSEQLPYYNEFIEREKMIRSRQPFTRAEQESEIDKYNNLKEDVFTRRE